MNSMETSTPATLPKTADGNPPPLTEMTPGQNWCSAESIALAETASSMQTLQEILAATSRESGS